MITSESEGGRFVIATPTKCGTTTLEEMARRHGGGRVSRGGVEVPSFRIARAEVGPRRQHRMVPPPGWESADRYIVVRNPLTRWISVYEYLRHPANYAKWGAKEVQGREWGGLKRGQTSWACDELPMTFEEFLDFIIGSRDLYMSPGSRWVRRRGPLDNAFAWRSPWIWLTPLDAQRDLLFSLAYPQGTPKMQGVIRLENLWDGLDALKVTYNLRTLSTRRSIHANKSLRWQGDAAWYWRGTCITSVSPVRSTACGACVACRAGVVREALSLGY